MPAIPLVRHGIGPLVLIGLLVALAGCAHDPGARGGGGGWASGGPDAAVESLQQDLEALAPAVSEEEARQAAACAHSASRQLAEEYGVIRPPLFHNFLVNVGLKKRGLCYHWAEDLMARLQALRLTTLDWHWGIARSGTSREHNCVVATAKGQPFEEGLVLDAWRHSGRLCWAPVRADRYPWKEGELDSPR